MTGSRTMLTCILFIMKLMCFHIKPILGSGPQVMQPSSSVKELNVWTFRASVGDGRLWFVKFYVPWCRGCKRMVGQYDELAETFKSNPNIVVARFDCMHDEEMCERLGVDRTPTLKLFLNGTGIETYKADFYHVDLMTPFLRRMLEKYMGVNKAHDDTAAVPGVGGGRASVPIPPSATDKVADTSGGSKAADSAASIDGGSKTSQTVTIEATSIDLGVYDRPAGATSPAGGRSTDAENCCSGDVTGQGGGNQDNVPDGSVPPQLHDSLSKGDVGPIDVAAAAVDVGSECSCTNDGGCEPLLRQGRGSRLAVKTLQKKEL